MDDIRGTAVGGPRLRGADFKPIDAAQGRGWRIRHDRLRRALDRLVELPPIEAIEVGGEHWVVDGHNRVALARERGLAFLDADVTGVTWPGGPRCSPGRRASARCWRPASSSGRPRRIAGPRPPPARSSHPPGDRRCAPPRLRLRSRRRPPAITDRVRSDEQARSQAIKTRVAEAGRPPGGAPTRGTP